MTTAYRPDANEPLTAVGKDLSEVEPVPNFPLVPSPQHLIESSSSMAQKWYSPPVMALAVRPEPKLIADDGGLLKSEFEPPLPNCP
jgi:hypothetical protein